MRERSVTRRWTNAGSSEASFRTSRGLALGMDWDLSGIIWENCIWVKLEGASLVSSVMIREEVRPRAMVACVVVDVAVENV